MALLVIHLWGKFWMAAWRGRRAMTWITGVIAFAASIVECFTGYLSQQNFDSQWISTSGKDAFNSVGVGAFFNVTNFGQMLMWHIVLIPIVLIAIVGAHVLLVRMRGVMHPIDAHAMPGRSGRARRRALAQADAAPWRGPTRRYDILKEGTIAVAVVLALTLGPGRPAVLAGRPAGHGRDVGPARARRLPGHRGHRAQRHTSCSAAPARQSTCIRPNRPVANSCMQDDDLGARGPAELAGQLGGLRCVVLGVHGQQDGRAHGIPWTGTTVILRAAGWLSNPTVTSRIPFW
jgi:hypothetical protein